MERKGRIEDLPKETFPKLKLVNKAREIPPNEGELKSCLRIESRKMQTYFSVSIDILD
ncbi:MAG: hypothetical protein QXU31_01885 [Archaeoglobaceae archaeon]